MAMTPLDIAATGATDSDRPIVTVPLPTELSIDDMHGATAQGVAVTDRVDPTRYRDLGRRPAGRIFLQQDC